MLPGSNRIYAARMLLGIKVLAVQNVVTLVRLKFPSYFIIIFYFLFFCLATMVVHIVNTIELLIIVLVTG